MWGSDCPYQVQGDHTYEASLTLITEKLDFLSDADKENILKNTADKLFFA
jgi:predicted TIM-barrel fold metal-dependent hydrolase